MLLLHNVLVLNKMEQRKKLIRVRFVFVVDDFVVVVVFLMMETILSNLMRDRQSFTASLVSHV